MQSSTAAETFYLHVAQITAFASIQQTSGFFASTTDALSVSVPLFTFPTLTVSYISLEV